MLAGFKFCRARCIFQRCPIPCITVEKMSQNELCSFFLEYLISQKCHGFDTVTKQISEIWLSSSTNLNFCCIIHFPTNWTSSLHFRFIDFFPFFKRIKEPYVGGANYECHATFLRLFSSKKKHVWYFFQHFYLNKFCEFFTHRQKEAPTIFCGFLMISCHMIMYVKQRRKRCFIASIFAHKVFKT